MFYNFIRHRPLPIKWKVCMKLNRIVLCLPFFSLTICAMDNNRLPKPDFSLIQKNNTRRRREDPPQAPRKQRPPRQIISNNLFEAAKNNDITAVECFLAKGANPNKVAENSIDKGKTPLLIATKMGHNVVVKLLLKADANPNQEIINSYDQATTPLYWAVKKATLAQDEKREQYIEIIHLLLKHDADINTINSYRWSDFPKEQFTSLWIAVQKHDLEIVQLLLENGANVNIALKQGKCTEITPVYTAAFDGHIGMLYFLLKKNPTLKTLQQAYNKNVSMIKKRNDPKDILSSKILRYRIEQLINKQLINKYLAKFPVKKRLHFKNKLKEFITNENQFDSYVYTQLMQNIVLSGDVIKAHDLIKKNKAKETEKRTSLETEMYWYLKNNLKHLYKKDISKKDKKIREECWRALLNINIFKGKFADDLLKLRDKEKEEKLMSGHMSRM